MAKNCPNCNSINPDNAQNCSNCETPLNPTKKISQPETRTINPTIKGINIGDVIDEKYKLLEELGKGGMGIVYKSEQIKPVKRTVALKIIKLGMDTHQVIARFEAERQALAVLDHPNIAKIYDAGMTENGRPYFVMEHVKGIPITDYCDKHKLNTRERLELFISLCDAVQHAHQKGIIHRDLKPSNVLVTIKDNKSIPKIIDFGIAKAIEHRLTEHTLFTEQGQMIGTPEYMSPEQAEMSGLDVDTRTDIYSLGIVLYEILVGVLPFDPESLRSAGFGEIQRIIRESDPPKASTRFIDLKDTQAVIAEQRDTDPASLIKQLKGDLDWVIMKAMEKDRMRRYDTPHSLAMDIRFHLKNKPILARPPSTGYRVRKFIRRHKAGVTAAVLVFLGLVMGVTGLTIGLREAVKAKNEAVQQSARVEAINEFLNSMLASPDPSREGREIKVIDILDRAQEQIPEKFKDKPEIEASVRFTLGETYEAIGVYEKSLAELETALNIQERFLGLDHPDTLNTMNSMGSIFIRLGKFQEAESLLLKLIPIKKKVLGAEHKDTIISMQNLGVAYYYQQKYTESEAIGRETLRIRRRVLGEDHEDVIYSLENLAIALAGQKKHEEAKKIYYEAKDLADRILEPNHPQTLRIMHNLACELKDSNEHNQAESLFKETLERQTEVFGPEHPDTIITMANMADLLNRMTRFQEAKTLAEKALALEEKVLGREHPLTKYTRSILDEAVTGVEKK